MKKLPVLFLFLLGFSSFQSHGQIYKNSILELNDNYIGGYTNFSREFRDKLHYDKNSLLTNFEGQYNFKFKINYKTDGNAEIQVVRIQRPKDNQASVETQIRQALQNLNYWKPQIDGKTIKISVRYSLDSSSCENAMICVKGLSLD